MFVKTNKGPWINLSTCRSIEVFENTSRKIKEEDGYG